MLDEKQITQLNLAFKKIFTMPISRSTFREVQNAIVAINPGVQDDSNQLFEALVLGEVKTPAKLTKDQKGLDKLIDDYSMPIRVAKDVYERGEFISLASSDIITQQNRVAFLNRVRRVDGEEMHFLTDTRGTINLVQHLVTRLQELEKNELGKGQLSQAKQELSSIKEKLDKLVK